MSEFELKFGNIINDLGAETREGPMTFARWSEFLAEYRNAKASGISEENLETFAIFLQSAGVVHDDEDEYRQACEELTTDLYGKPAPSVLQP